MEYCIVKNFINGVFCDSVGDRLKIESPVDGSILGETFLSNKEDVKKTVALAKEAQKKWGALTFKKRAEILFKYRNLLVERRDELAQGNHLENGKLLEEAYAGVDKAIELTEFACSIPQIISGKVQETSNGIFSIEEMRPLGVVASITPFNFPVMVPHWTVPNAIALGNAMILKPSELTPISAMKMAELFKEAGLPDGIFNVINGGKEVVEEICINEDIKAVSFVGSTDVAKIVYKNSSNALKRVLALGEAKNHIIVLPDASVKTSIRDIISSAFGMSGQRCMAASVIVAVGDIEKIIDGIVEKTVSMVPGIDLSPVINKNSIEKIKVYIENARVKGAKILVNGLEAKQELSNGGYNIGGTIIDWRGVDSEMGEKEVFGPVLEIVSAKNIKDAIEIQNKSPYGNGASIFTQSGKYAQDVWKELTAGMIGINIGVPVPREPFSFGGMKLSKLGHGDITGISSLSFWTNTVKITSKWNVDEKLDWMS